VEGGHVGSGAWGHYVKRDVQKFHNLEGGTAESYTEEEAEKIDRVHVIFGKDLYQGSTEELGLDQSLPGDAESLDTKTHSRTSRNGTALPDAVTGRGSEAYAQE